MMLGYPSNLLCLIYLRLHCLFTMLTYCNVELNKLLMPFFPVKICKIDKTVSMI